jgi:ribonucleoside-diphosphate reductase beta chain
MLSWDDYEETPAGAPAEQAVIATAVQQQLDADAAQQAAAQAAAEQAAQQAAAQAAAEQAAQQAAAAQAQQAQQQAAAQAAAPAPVDAASGKEQRVTVDAKRMINARADLNQLVPFKYDWAWQKYIDGCANHWMPQEVNMNADIALWKSEDGLTPDERMIVKRNLGFFSTADSLVANNLVLAIYRLITNPSAASTCCARPSRKRSTPTPTSTAWSPWAWMRARSSTCTTRCPAWPGRASWGLSYTRAISDPTFSTGTAETDRELLKNLIAYYCVLEGIFFYCGFTQILSMGRRNKMTGTSEQFQYILRDESMHVNFGIDVINQIKLENPHLWDEEMQSAARGMILEGTELEVSYARDTMPRGVLGMNANMMEEYLQFIANRRLAQIGLSEQYPGVKNPFPWMSEIMDLKKEKNFFETRVTDYQTGGALTWD